MGALWGRQAESSAVLAFQEDMATWRVSRDPAQVDRRRVPKRVWHSGKYLKFSKAPPLSHPWDLHLCWSQEGMEGHIRGASWCPKALRPVRGKRALGRTVALGVTKKWWLL